MTELSLSYFYRTRHSQHFYTPRTTAMILWLSVTFIVGFFGYFLLTRKKEKVSQLQKPDFEKDKVYLVQFPGTYLNITYI